MAGRFNNTQGQSAALQVDSMAQADTVNRAGAKAFSKTAKMKLASLVLTSFLTDQSYRSGQGAMDELAELSKEAGYEFAAKTALYGRHKFGMRSTSHVIAGEIASNVKKEQWTKFFFDKVVRRVDDMSEILGYLESKHGTIKPVPNSVKKGFKKAFNKFDDYQLAKYKMAGKDISLVDLVNLVHPEPVHLKNATSLEQLVNDELKNTKTWEAKVSKAGNSEDKEAAKTDAWRELLSEGKLGYLALLRNISNIVETNDTSLLNMLNSQLTNKVAVEKSLVMPHQIYTAYTQVQSRLSTMKATDQDKLVESLDLAFIYSTGNILLPEGETLVALDTSGSMSGDTLTKGAVMAAAVAIGGKSDMMLFDTRAQYINIVRRIPPMVAIESLINSRLGGGTDFGQVFRSAEKSYDNVVLISDGESWAHSWRCSPEQERVNYTKRFNKKPAVFILDMTGYGTTQFPADKVAETAGFTRETLQTLGKLISNPQALVDEIEAISLYPPKGKSLVKAYPRGTGINMEDLENV